MARLDGKYLLTFSGRPLRTNF